MRLLTRYAKEKSEGWLDLTWSSDVYFCLFSCVLFHATLFDDIERIKYYCVHTLLYSRYIENPQLDWWLLDAIYGSIELEAKGVLFLIRPFRQAASVKSEETKKRYCINPCTEKWMSSSSSFISKLDLITMEQGRQERVLLFRLLKIHCLEKPSFPYRSSNTGIW